MDKKEISDKIEGLKELLGTPRNRDTGFQLVGPHRNKLHDMRKGKDTKYRIMGHPTRFLVNKNLQKIAQIVGYPRRRIVSLDMEDVGYYIGCHGKIMYDPSLRSN
jgi:hypothetical protein